MTDKIIVNTSELKKQINRMNGLLEEYRQNVKMIYTECLNQVEKSWKSNENIAYINNLNDYTSDLEELESFIKGYINVLENTVQIYEEAQEEAKQIATSGKE